MDKVIKYYEKVQNLKHELIKELGVKLAYKMFEQVYHDPLWKDLGIKQWEN